METNIENGKIINEKIPEVIGYSDQYKKEMKKLLRLNNIFSEFENKASKELNFFIDESNRRYSMSKCGINIKGLISSTRKKCLDESKKILNDNFYSNKIIEREKEKMKHKGNTILYKKLKNSMNIVKNPELRKNKTKIEKNNTLVNGVNGKNNRYNYNYNKTNIDNSEKIMDIIINEEQKSLSKSIDKYKSNLDQLKTILETSPVINRRKNSNAYKKLNLYLPNLKFISYATKKEVKKNMDMDDPAKKADIHKLLPFSKLGKNNLENIVNSELASKHESRKSVIFPYITEPKPKMSVKREIPKDFQYYKDYQNTISVVANSANKELFANKNFDKKRTDVENFLKVDDIPNVQIYDDLAHQKANEVKEERRSKNNIISKKQNYLKLSIQQRMNLDIDKNISLIKDIEDNLYKKGNKTEKNNL